MKKILIVMREFNMGGGISQFVLDYYNAIAKMENIKIDLLVEDGLSEEDKNLFVKEIGFIQVSDFKANLFQYIKDWKVLSNNIENTYDFVHIHTDNLVRFFYLFFLRKKGNVIVHSHNSFNDYVANSRLKKYMDNLGKLFVKTGKFYKFACSDLAAKWLFGNSDYTQINNAVDLELYKFNKSQRELHLKEMNIENKHIYGHIGRFAYQKNHEKLIEIFENIYSKDINSILLLIGQGEKEQEIKELVTKKGLTEVVKFLGHRSDVSELLNAMDSIIFPSHYEGLPLSLVEAQANGVSVFYSSDITKEVKLLPQSFSFNNSESSAKIADKILSSKTSVDRELAVDILKERGYDKQDSAKYLYNFYQNNGEICK